MRFTAFQYNSVQEKCSMFYYFWNWNALDLQALVWIYAVENHVTYFLCVLDAEKKKKNTEAHEVWTSPESDSWKMNSVIALYNLIFALLQQPENVYNYLYGLCCTPGIIYA